MLNLSIKKKRERLRRRVKITLHTASSLFVHSDPYINFGTWYMIYPSEYRPVSDLNWQDLLRKQDHIYNVKILDHNILWLFQFIFAENFMDWSFSFSA